MKKNPERLKWIREMNSKLSSPPHVSIGKNCNVHSALLGTPSFSLERDSDGAWVRGQQLGDVEIGDDVAISPFSIIRRATMPNTATKIGDGTKISSFVNIGHNSRVGKHVFIAPLVNLDGSVEIGDYVYIAPHVQINNHVKVGEGAIIGAGSTVIEDVPPYETVVGTPAKPIWHRGNDIDASFSPGINFKIGKFCIIEPDVVVGDDVSLGSFVHLRSGTHLANNVHFGSYCKTTGLCYLGNHVDIRTGATISKSVIVEDWAFIGPGVMTNHTKNVIHGRADLEEEQFITRIGYGVIIGSSAQLIAGVTVGDNVIIGASGVVTKDISEPAIYVGNPLRKLRDLPQGFLLERPIDYTEHEFTGEALKKYLPYYKRGE